MLNSLRTAGALIFGSCVVMTTPALAQSRDVTIVDIEEPVLADPCHMTRQQTAKILRNNVIETLTQPTPDGEVTPLLATEWEQTDANTWRFKLREGVTFQDGTPFNADAVIYSVERVFDPTLTCHVRDQALGGNTLTATAVDDLTVEIRTEKPSPIFPRLASAIPIVSTNLPKSAETDAPVGTGPFDFAEWVRGDHITLEARDDYWGEAPAVQKATYVWRGDSSIIAGMVALGEADIAPQVSVQDATNPETDKAYLNLETTLVRIGLAKPPLDDVRVRRALNLAVDREALLGAFFPEDSLIATQVVVPGTNGYNDALEPWPYDPEEAQKLLAEAAADGVPVDQQIDISARLNHFPNSQEIYEAVAAMWTAVGFNVNLKIEETGSWVKYWVTKPPSGDKPNPDVTWGQHDNTYGDAAYSLYTLYHSTGQQSSLDDPAFDELLDNANLAEPDARTKGFQDAFAMNRNEIVADVPMFHMVNFARVNPRVNWEPDALTNARIDLSTITFND